MKKCSFDNYQKKFCLKYFWIIYSFIHIHTLSQKGLFIFFLGSSGFCSIKLMFFFLHSSYLYFTLLSILYFPHPITILLCCCSYYVLIQQRNKNIRQEAHFSSIHSNHTHIPSWPLGHLIHIDHLSPPPKSCHKFGESAEACLLAACPCSRLIRSCWLLVGSSADRHIDRDRDRDSPTPPLTNAKKEEHNSFK
jgi:hypothetical protein